MSSQRRSPRPTTTDQLELIAVDDYLETQRASHIEIRRVARLFARLFPSISLIEAWMVASDLVAGRVFTQRSGSLQMWEAMAALSQRIVRQLAPRAA